MNELDIDSIRVLEDLIIETIYAVRNLHYFTIHSSIDHSFDNWQIPYEVLWNNMIKA